MQDQVDSLARAGIRASYVNSMLDYREVMERIEKAQHGWFRMLYVAPERFESRVFIDRVKQIPMSMFVVDEAHCISEWGHDFRPSYTKLHAAIELLGSPQVLAFTATATPDVRQDIRKQLALADPVVIVRGFDRPNLSFQVVNTGLKREYILKECGSGECGVVYAGTRAAVDELTEMLLRFGVNAASYHAGLPDERRKETQARFIGGEIDVIVATSAFGMGIDKPNVRFVIHHDMPMTLEQYYQEAGRAGRDGGESRCIMLHQPNDKSLPEFFIRSSCPDKTLVQTVYATLHNQAGTEIGGSYGGLISATSQTLATGIGSVSETAVRGALDLLEKHGYVRRINASYTGSTVQFLLDVTEMREWLIDSAPPHLSSITVALLRMVGGEAFYGEVPLDLDDFARKSFHSMEDILAGMNELASAGLIKFKAGRKGTGIALPGVRVKAGDIDVRYHEVEQRMRHQRSKLLALEQYIDGRACRRNMILEYFEERDVKGICGKCDNCVRPAMPAPEPDDMTLFDKYVKSILECAAELGGRFGRAIIVDVLRGAKTQRITQYALDTANSYGAARRSDKAAMMELVDKMVGMGLLARSDSMIATISITDSGREQLGRDVPPLALPLAGQVDAKVNDTVLFEALRAVRRRIAARLNVASHTLLPDAVLAAITNAAPQDKASLLEVDGVGPAGYQKYGKELLKALREHAHELALGGAMEKTRTALAALGSSVRSTLDLAVKGLSLDDIASSRGMSEGTISAHISEIIKSGFDLDINRIVPPHHQEQILRAIRTQRLHELKKIKAVVDADVTFASIRIMLAVVSSRQ
jgi:ATP-dependent DNA helicase RecQ